MKRILRFLMIGLAVVIAALAVVRFRQTRQTPPTLAVDIGAVPAFRLTDSTNAPFDSSVLSGKTWVADFVFTRCMGPCPLLSARMAALQDEFSSKKDLRFVSFSVDPEHDTPERLAAYAKNQNAVPGRWYFLTGPKKEIYDLIRNGFKVAAEEPVQKTSVDFIHSTLFMLVGPDGHIHGAYNAMDESALQNLRAALQQVP